MGRSKSPRKPDDENEGLVDGRSDSPIAKNLFILKDRNTKFESPNWLKELNRKKSRVDKKPVEHESGKKEEAPLIKLLDEKIDNIKEVPMINKYQVLDKSTSNKKPEIINKIPKIQTHVAFHTKNEISPKTLPDVFKLYQEQSIQIDSLQKKHKELLRRISNLEQKFQD